MGIATGETFSFAEGKLVLYASASGTTSGSGIAFVRDASLTFAYGWVDYQNADKTVLRRHTGQRADLTCSHLYADRTLYNLAQATAAVQARFEGLVTGSALGKSALWALYSGVVDEFGVRQGDGEMFQASFSMHANQWSAFGQ